MAFFGLKGMTIYFMGPLVLNVAMLQITWSKYFPQVIVCNKLLVINIIFSVILNFTHTQASLIW